MDQRTIRRHNLVFISDHGKEVIWKEVTARYRAEELSTCKTIEISFSKDILQGEYDIPAFIRRSEYKSNCLAIGFVHHNRINGNRLRLGAYVDFMDVKLIMSPYELLEQKINYVHSPKHCINVLKRLYEIAVNKYGLQIGVLGSSALELATGLSYTDDNSDIDLLVKPASYEKLSAFYLEAKNTFIDMNMDFELDLPNGYGVKLLEVFMKTKTVLGKGLSDVRLLNRDDVIKYLI